MQFFSLIKNNVKKLIKFVALKWSGADSLKFKALCD